MVKKILSEPMYSSYIEVIHTSIQMDTFQIGLIWSGAIAWIHSEMGPSECNLVQHKQTLRLRYERADRMTCAKAVGKNQSSALNQ